MQRSNLKPERRNKRDASHFVSGDDSSGAMDAWTWAERISLVGLFALAVSYTLFVVQDLFIPLVTAWVMGAILRRIVESAERVSVPRVLAVIATATVALLTLLAIMGLLSTPLAYWISHTRELALLIKGKLQLLNQPLAIFDEIAHALSGVSEGAAPASAVNYDSSTIIRGIVSTLTPVLTQFVLFFFAMIFWMLYANEVKGGIVRLFSGDKAGQVARRILDDAENKVSQYFGTIVIVNLCLAILAIGLASAVGLPNPLLWGVLAGTLSFIPYLGPAIIVATFFVIGILNFTSLTDALVAPIMWILVTTLEGQVITPMIVGHRLTLNPFLVFLSVAFWAWMWGPLGALLAVPLLISAAVVNKHLSSYSAVRLVSDNKVERPRGL
jgi:predicted PurR-regulated permease PerM